MIDIFTHILPMQYLAALEHKAALGNVPRQRLETLKHAPPALLNLDNRLQVMDQLPDMLQVLTLIGPPLEVLAGSADAADLARIVNNELAEIVRLRPDKFAAIASLPLNDIETALVEIDRAVNRLGLHGIQIFSDINFKPLDSAEFFPIYEKMQQYDLPIFIHPQSESMGPDYPGEQGSRYNLTALIGWPHATSMAMLRLACGGVLEKYPKLKLVTHHSGGTIPYLASRIGHAPFKPDNLKGAVNDSLKLFNNDTAVQGNTANLMCAYAFCGAEHMLFGTDFPMAGPDLVRETIRSIQEMSVTEMEKQQIFEGNARKLLKI
jgi:uncharacterized protein